MAPASGSGGMKIEYSEMGAGLPSISPQRTMVYTPSLCRLKRSEMSAEMVKLSPWVVHSSAVIQGNVSWRLTFA